MYNRLMTVSPTLYVGETQYLKFNNMEIQDDWTICLGEMMKNILSCWLPHQFSIEAIYIDLA